MSVVCVDVGVVDFIDFSVFYNQISEQIFFLDFNTLLTSATVHKGKQLDQCLKIEITCSSF